MGKGAGAQGAIGGTQRTPPASRECYLVTWSRWPLVDGCLQLLATLFILLWVDGLDMPFVSLRQGPPSRILR